MSATLKAFLVVFGVLLITACAGRSGAGSPPESTSALASPSAASVPARQATPAGPPACTDRDIAQASDSGAPLGCTLVMPSVGKGGNYDLGREVTLALDENDDPMIAYVLYDPNGTTQVSDSTLHAIRWDRAAHRWKDPVAVDTVGAILTNPPNRQVSLTRDAATGALGIAYMKGEQQIWLALSQDGGITWIKQLLDSNEFTMDNPILAMRGGVIHVAYNSRFVRCGKSGCDGVVYRTRTGLQGEFARVVVPEVAGTNGNRRFSPVGLALDSTGRAGLAYYSESPSDTAGIDRDTLAFWRPDEKPAYRVTDSGNTPNDWPSLALAFDGTKPRIAYLLRRENDASNDLWFSASDDGKNWGAPVPIPRDGRDGTDWDQALALDSQGRAAVASYWHSATKTEPGQCGGPKLFRSSDMQNWTACGVDIRRAAGTQGRYVSLSFTRAGKIILAFQNQANADLRAGVYLFREP